MDQNSFPNFKQRRRSNLGRRRVINDEHAPRNLPVFPVPTVRNLGLSSSRSGKKSHNKFDKASSSYNFTKKKLFLNKSPLSDSGSSTSVQELCGASSKRFYNSPLNSSSNVFDSSSLNITGIASIQKSPSPDNEPATSSSSCAYRSYTTLSLTPCYERKTSKQKSFFADEVFGKLELPKSPGPSKYNQLILEELADLKPPVDPDDLLLMKSFSLKEDTTPFKIPTRPFTSTAIKTEETVESFLSLKEEEKPSTVFGQKPITSITETEDFSTIIHSLKNETKSSSKISEAVTKSLNCLEGSSSRMSLIFSPHLSSTYIGGVSPSPNKAINFGFVSGCKQKEKDKKLSVISEDLDSTNSFLMAEQTIIDQNNTIIAPTTSESVASKPVHCDRDIELVSKENEIDSDVELDQVLQQIDQIVEQMGTMRKTVEKLKKHKCKCKTNNNVSNKENVPETASKGEIKWMSNLKSNNPGLLKTPKMVKTSNSRLSLMNQSTIWTPQSLSTVLHEQVEDLFD